MIVEIVLLTDIFGETGNHECLIEAGKLCTWDSLLSVETFDEGDGSLEGNMESHVDAWVFVQVFQFMLHDYQFDYITIQNNIIALIING